MEYNFTHTHTHVIHSSNAVVNAHFAPINVTKKTKLSIVASLKNPSKHIIEHRKAYALNWKWGRALEAVIPKEHYACNARRFVSNHSNNYLQQIHLGCKLLL